MTKLVWKHKDTGGIGIATRNPSRTLEEDLKILSFALPEYEYVMEIEDEAIQQADRSKREAWIWDKDDPEKKLKVDQAKVKK